MECTKSNFDISFHGDGPPPTLRPSLRQYFPVFSREHLKGSLQKDPFHVSTLLRLENVKTATEIEPNSVYTFLKSGEEKQRAQLAETLTIGGVSYAVAAAVAAVRRSEFVKIPSFNPFSNLNCSIPFSPGSWLTPQYLVGLMLDRLQMFTGARVLEIGAGAGFHLASIWQLCAGAVQLCGIEINSAYCAFGNSVLHNSEYGNEIELVEGDGTTGWPKHRMFDRLYCTAVVRTPTELPVHQLEIGGLLQCVRSLSQEEYACYPISSKIRRLFPSFEDYERTGWQKFCCLSTMRRENHGLVEIDKLFDVKFVPLYHDRNLDLGRETDEDPFSFLREAS